VYFCPYPIVKIPFEIRERVLNHSMDRIVETYDKYDFQDEMREALQSWADYLEDIPNQKTATLAKVIPFRRVK